MLPCQREDQFGRMFTLANFATVHTRAFAFEVREKVIVKAFEEQELAGSNRKATVEEMISDKQPMKQHVLSTNSLIISTC